MRRRYRLRDSERFQYVRRQGESRKGRLVILIYLKNGLDQSRFGFSASRRVGKAVQRNRARRLMRESVRLQFQDIASGWDMIFLARSHIVGASFSQVDADCRRVLHQAGLLRPAVSSASSSLPLNV
ncbi:MAG: ribonuclease P protein component [Caldilineales bacterium]|nr:ribonuclease P protein component [Caldilineales bacterium]